MLTIAYLSKLNEESLYYNTLTYLILFKDNETHMTEKTTIEKKSTLMLEEKSTLMVNLFRIGI